MCLLISSSSKSYIRRVITSIPYLHIYCIVEYTSSTSKHSRHSLHSHTHKVPHTCTSMEWSTQFKRINLYTLSRISSFLCIQLIHTHILLPCVLLTHYNSVCIPYTQTYTSHKALYICSEVINPLFIVDLRYYQPSLRERSCFVSPEIKNSRTG